MSRTPFMQLYVSDYLGDTMHLTTEQHGAYLLLLMTMWRHNGSLPFDDGKLARIARVNSKRWHLIKDDVLAFFTIEGGQISQKRLNEELQKAVSISQKRKSSGKLGGMAKSLKNNDAGLASAKQMLKHSQKPDTIKVKETLNSVSQKRGSRLPDDFKADLSEAVRLGLSEQDAHREADKFRDYWNGQPGQRGVKLDWLATWRNWCRSAVERKQQSRKEPPPKPRNIGDAIRDEARRLGVLRNEPDSENSRFYGEGHAAGNVTVLDLAFKPTLKGFG
ncbi:YdaU family protein [Brucellaceae bacterium C25G]